MDSKWSKRFRMIKTLAWLLLAGVSVLILSLAFPEDYRVWPLSIGIALCLPAMVYVYIVTIWHWKDRYKGRHSDLWGALLLIETSGWMKLVYLFRHIIPDMRQSGRYRKYPPLPDVF